MQQEATMPSISRGWWIALAGLAVFLVALGVGVSYPQIRIMLLVRQLHSRNPGVRPAALDQLRQMGTPGQLAILRAVRSDDEAMSADAWQVLRDAIRNDRINGRPIEQIVRAASEGIHDPGEIGPRCAAIAAEGWPAGLLDDPTKRAITQHCLQVKVEARSEYPLGKGSPVVLISGRNLSSTVYFRFMVYPVVDGKDLGQSCSGIVGTSGSVSSGIPNATGTPGQHTAQARVAVQLTEFRPEGQFQPVDDADWKMELESEPVGLNVVENVPAEYLQAKATPGLDDQVRKVVRVVQHPGDKGTYSYGFEGREVEIQGSQFPLVHLTEPLPVDLAFKDVWRVAESGKTCDGGFLVVLKGRTDDRMLQVPYALREALRAPGEQTVTVKITLSGSLDAAVSVPGVEAYWPGTIELPEMTMRVTVKKQ
jgi:hypothetical protein